MRLRAAVSAHPIRHLDDVVHQRARLGILAIANEAHKVDFGCLRESLALTAGNLSQHLRTLESAGLVTLEKRIERRRPRTWVSITREGRRALQREIAALRAIIERVEEVNSLVITGGDVGDSDGERSAG